jgi:uncharacterized membrane protein YuzA (DUF378 family)
MKLIHGILIGIGGLILVYLGVNNPNGVATIFGAAGSQTNTLVKTLQGR